MAMPGELAGGQIEASQAIGRRRPESQATEPWSKAGLHVVSPPALFGFDICNRYGRNQKATDESCFGGRS